MTGIKSIAFVVFLLLIFSLAFMKPALTWGGSAITPTDLLFPIVVAGWTAAAAFGVFRFRWIREYWTFALYFGALFLSAIFSANPQGSYQKLVVPIYLILLATVTASMITTHARMRFVVLTWLAASLVSVAAAVLGIGLFYFAPDCWLMEALTSHSGAVPVGNFPRVSSTFVSPSMFCNFLSVTVVIALAAKRVGWIGRISTSILIALLGISAIFTFSIALGGFFLAIGLWLWFDRAEQKLIGKTTSAICVTAAFASLIIAPIALPADLWSSTDIFSIASASESSRFTVWRESIHTFLSHPITGSGIGTAAANVQYRNYDGSLSLLTDAHNSFLSVAAQAGVIGLVSILVLVGMVLKTASSHLTKSKMGILRLAFAIAFLTAFVFEGLTGSFEETRHLWVLIGLIIAARRIEHESDDESTSLNRA